MSVGRHFLLAEALAVYFQLDSRSVRVNPDLDRLAFFAFPVPMGNDVNLRPISPPGLVIVEVVLCKPAYIHDAEVRVDAGPAIRCRLALVVEASPNELARHP